MYELTSQSLYLAQAVSRWPETT